MEIIQPSRPLDTTVRKLYRFTLLYVRKFIIINIIICDLSFLLFAFFVLNSFYFTYPGYFGNDLISVFPYMRQITKIVIMSIALDFSSYVSPQPFFLKHKLLIIINRLFNDLIVDITNFFLSQGNSFGFAIHDRQERIPKITFVQMFKIEVFQLPSYY